MYFHAVFVHVNVSMAQWRISDLCFGLTNSAGRLHWCGSIQWLLLLVFVLVSTPMAAVVVVMVVGSVLALDLPGSCGGLGQAGPLQVVLPQPDLMVVLRCQRGRRASDGTEVDDRLWGGEETWRDERAEQSRGAAVVVFTQSPRTGSPKYPRHTNDTTGGWRPLV